MSDRDAYHRSVKLISVLVLVGTACRSSETSDVPTALDPRSSKDPDSRHQTSEETPDESHPVAVNTDADASRPVTECSDQARAAAVLPNWPTRALAELIADRKTVGRFNTEGYVTSRNRRYRCSPGAICKQSPPANITLSTRTGNVPGLHLLTAAPFLVGDHIRASVMLCDHVGELRAAVTIVAP